MLSSDEVNALLSDMKLNGCLKMPPDSNKTNRTGTRKVSAAKTSAKASAKTSAKTSAKVSAKRSPTVQSSSTETSIASWNFEDAEELRGNSGQEISPKLVVFSRDWTVETIVRQIEQGNIDLDPDFQRRNAWQDDRRSRLIESFVLNFPVPQVVLAEHPEKKKSFIVIDGKQRLMTIAGFYLDSFRAYWNKPVMRGLKLLTKLNGMSIDDLRNSLIFKDELRQLENADIRTTVIADFEDDGTLYDIFYRLNTGSVPLSSQELRQVLHRGPFSKHLIDATDLENPLWAVLGLDGPDPRLRDVELVLRMVALLAFSSEYKGNLKPFLDNVMRSLNAQWESRSDATTAIIAELFAAIKSLSEVFGSNVGRKFKNDRYEPQFNRALFEVQAYYLCDPVVRSAFIRHKRKVVTEFEKLCSSDPTFLSSIEATTKSVENYRKRFGAYRKMLGTALGVLIPEFRM